MSCEIQKKNATTTKWEKVFSSEVCAKTTAACANMMRKTELHHEINCWLNDFQRCKFRAAMKLTSNFMIINFTERLLRLSIICSLALFHGHPSLRQWPSFRSWTNEKTNYHYTNIHKQWVTGHFRQRLKSIHSLLIVENTSSSPGLLLLQRPMVLWAAAPPHYTPQTRTFADFLNGIFYLLSVAAETCTWSLCVLATGLFFCWRDN